MANKENEQQRGQLPPFIKIDKDWCFNIRWEDDILYYETRWTPNTNVMVQVADRYGAGFTLEYDEIANGLYGKSEYINGVLTDISLEWGDFACYSFDDKKDQYLFEGKYYDSDFEILEILLERKLTD